MARANSFETTHYNALKSCESDALKALQEIVKDKGVDAAVRVEAARTILKIRSDDA